MSKELYENRQKEFKEYVNREQQMPRVWKARFSDNDDMRLWFKKISELERFSGFVKEVNDILSKFNLKILTNKEKEAAFLAYINEHNQIPIYGEAYFSDNDEMFSWYISYKERNQNFETMVHNNLKEYQDLDLAAIWPNIKEEFMNTIRTLQRIPKHGEAFTLNGIDIRAIYDKLESFDPKFTEELMLYLQTFNPYSLSKEKRAEELLLIVSDLGYIPFLQESRFSDGTDMFTWYNKYKHILPNLENEVKARVNKQEPKRKVNIYLIPNFKNHGGKFYTICANEGERLDLSGISSYEEAKKLDSTFTKRGGAILKQDEEIASINDVKGKAK